MKKSLCYSLSKCSIFLAFVVVLQSCNPWFLWDNTLVGNIAIVLFLICRVLLINKVSYRYKCLIIFLFLFYFWMGICQAALIQTPIVYLVKTILPLFFIVIMERQEKRSLKKLTLNLFSLILLISICAYILVIFFGFPLQPVEIRHPTNTGYPPYQNYYFFMMILHSSQFFRFRSIFTEPGHLGMFCALLLYINGYSIKKLQNVIMLITLFLTFSLAAYVLLFCGWFIYEFMSGLSFRRLGKILLVICVFVSISWYYLSDDARKIFQSSIIERLAYDEEKGIQGNNRNTQTFIQVYENLSMSEYLFGKGSVYMTEKFENSANSSYKNFIMTYGIVGLILLFAFFFSAIYAFPSKLALGMFFLFVLSFLQRPYWLWEIESWMFLCAVTIFYYDKKSLLMLR